MVPVFPWQPDPAKCKLPMVGKSEIDKAGARPFPGHLPGWGGNEGGKARKEGEVETEFY